VIGSDGRSEGFLTDRFRLATSKNVEMIEGRCYNVNS